MEVNQLRERPYIICSLTKDEKEKVKQFCKDQGYTVSLLMRKLLFDFIKKTEK